jgi:hypothetical protein
LANAASRTGTEAAEGEPGPSNATADVVDKENGDAAAVNLDETTAENTTTASNSNPGAVEEDIKEQDAEIKEELQKEESSESRVEHGEDEDEEGSGKDGSSAGGGGGDPDAGSAGDSSSPASSPLPQDPSPPDATSSKKESQSDPSAEGATDPPAEPGGQEADAEKTEKELEAEEARVWRVSGFGAAAGLLAMIFTAYQMNENPDGIYAATCRLVLTICNLLFRLALAPCHRCCPGLLAPSGGAHYPHHTYGHVPAALDYGYRDPAVELS